MNDTRVQTIDDLLEAYVCSTDDRSASLLLVRIVEEHVEPIARSVVGQKLQTSIRAADDRALNQDALELVSQIKTAVVGRLTMAERSAHACSIESLAAYVRAVAINAVNNYVRQKYPRRISLKNQIRYILNHDDRFSLWQAEDGRYMCASREIDSPEGSADDLDLRARADQILNSAGITASTASVVEIVTSILTQIDRPIVLDELVSTIYDLKAIRETTSVAADDVWDHAALRHYDKVAEKVENASFLKSLWDEIKQLPLRHRTALLLNLRGADGEGLIILLPVAHVASITEIAEMLGFSAVEFAGIWNELPWDDNRIAQHLGIERQQVINLRQSARARLKRCLK